MKFLSFQSDLWLPLGIAAVSVIFLMGLHWVMLRWQLSRTLAAQKPHTDVESLNPTSFAAAGVDDAITKLVPLNTMTAPQRPVQVVDYPVESEADRLADAQALQLARETVLDAPHIDTESSPVHLDSRAAVLVPPAPKGAKWLQTTAAQAQTSGSLDGRIEPSMGFSNTVLQPSPQANPQATLQPAAWMMAGAQAQQPTTQAADAALANQSGVQDITPDITPNIAASLFPFKAIAEVATPELVAQSLDSQNQDASSDSLSTSSAPQAIDIVRLPHAHPKVHYQMRLAWDDATQIKQLAQALFDTPWVHALPVCLCMDSEASKALAIAPTRSVRLAWQVVSRHHLADAEGLAAFQAWCATIAQRIGASLEPVTQMPWDDFVDAAHSSVLSLDSVITLRLAVPPVQLDQLAQSLGAARFVPEQEHWLYWEPSSDLLAANTADTAGVLAAPRPASAFANSLVLERLWQGVNPATLAAQAESKTLPAVFQLVIDIPNVDSLEARKVYMRLRSVARVSAAVLQSANGTPLSDSTLDTYSQALMSRQDALSMAGFVPGGALAQSLYAPRLR